MNTAELEAELNRALAQIESLDAECDRRHAALEQMQAERDAALAGAVKVKPLEWIDNPDQALDCWMVDDFGLYQITDELVLFAGHESTGRKFDTLEAAKAAAQADYEARIIASIQPDTEAVEMAEAAAFSAGFEAGQRDEREACAVLIETRDGSIPYRQEIAAAIRKRGED